MTVIAYRNGIMASDSCWTSQGTQTVSMIKIKRLSSGSLLGFSGDNDARAIEAILDKIKDPRKLPSRDELATSHVDFQGLLAFPRGGVYVISSSKIDQSGWVDNEDDEAGVWPAATMAGYAAVGSGGDFALAAMDAGASAKQAVEIACRRSIFCRLPVHTVALHENKLVRRSEAAVDRRGRR
jgi:hypothetical protein